MKLNFIKNCGDAQVIIISENATLKLNKDCELIPNACVEITKDFSSANVRRISKRLMNNIIKLFLNFFQRQNTQYGRMDSSY